MTRLPRLFLHATPVLAAVALVAWIGQADTPATPDPAPSPRVPTSALEVTLSYAPVVRQAAPSVVNIYAQRVVATSPFAGDPFFSHFLGQPHGRPRVQNALGSGVIIGTDNIVVSNYHVVGDSTDIRVVLADRREYDARILLADPGTDVAVLQLVDAPVLPGLTLANSDQVAVGDLVLAIGNPFGVGQTVSSGIVSAKARSSVIAGREGHFIQTDAPINPGNSGGALVDMTGRVVGINTAILTRSGGSNGIGFAIPANLVRQFVEQARAGNDRLARPWSGLSAQPVDAALAEALDMELPRGVMITALHPGSPFAAAGLAVGDVIVPLGGQPVDGEGELAFRLMALGPGADVEVLALRNGSEVAATIPLIPPPDTPPRNPVRIAARSILNGLSASNVNPAVIADLNLPQTSTGVVVTSVEGIATRTGLRPGDLIQAINGIRVTTTGDLATLADRPARGYEIELVRNGQHSRIRVLNR